MATALGAAMLPSCYDWNLPLISETSEAGGSDASDAAICADAAHVTGFAASVPIYSGEMGPQNIAVDASRVYWYASGASTVRGALKATGSSTPYNVVDTANSPGTSEPHEVLASPPYVYAGGKGNCGCANILRAAPDGSQAQAPFSLWSDHWGNIKRLTLANGYFYALGDGNLKQQSLDGTQQMLIAGGLPPLADEIGSVAANTTVVYWGGAATPLQWMPLAQVGTSTAARTCAPPAGVDATVRDIAADDRDVVWLTAGGFVLASDVACAQGAVVLASGQMQPTRIALDQSHVFWSNAGDGHVMAVELPCGQPTSIAQGVSAYGVAVDSSGVYWSDYGGGTIQYIRRL
jgi:hypothetical protein